jgi:hypothetical protein
MADRKRKRQSASVVTRRRGRTKSSGLHKNEMGYFATITSVIALLVSISSGVFTYVSSRESSAADTIKTQYQLFADMVKLEIENPYLGHIFAEPRRYNEVKARVVEAVANMPDDEKAKNNLKERAVADYIFLLFEHTIFQKREAADSFFDWQKAQFDQEVLDFFTGRLLRNPRLLYYWDENLGGLSDALEVVTKIYYKDHVLKDPHAPLKELPDTN